VNKVLISKADGGFEVAGGFISADVVKIVRILVHHQETVLAVKTVRTMCPNIRGLREAKCFVDAVRHAVDGIVISYTLADEVSSFDLKGD
jgi:hypothetical protein